ncbi:hypothetical protein [Effusibacillus consociatus]|uniref:ABC transporter permease n=1 Tax=Effusibacillus consociatus TaxID=1117041 RepID=A0ABV9Q036_9BACL
MKKNRKRFYQWLFSFTTLFLLLSLLAMWTSPPRLDQISTGGAMNSDLTMGTAMMKHLFSAQMNFVDWFTPMSNMMATMKGVMATDLLYDALNFVLTVLLIVFTALLIGGSIILGMLWT